VKRAAEDGLVVLRGFTPADLQALVAESMERVLRPLVYAESLDLLALHRSRGEPVYIVSAELQEIVQAIADDLGFDGALGTVCEVVGGKYTGRAIRALHADNKARCIQELGHDLGASTAYSDSHTDLPFLEAVGHPVAVNPDRALRRIAAERRWPVLEFGRRAA
jgi:HAD superfamily hydrolase (TIGR01490 family)